MFIKLRFLERLYTTKFQGNPVKTIPLKNSIIPNKRENIKKALKIFLGL